MNYRHAYHAGNHADVFKHIVLARIVEHLKKKEKPFRVLDVHAGIGLYALASGEALKTLEWQNGVGKLYDHAGTPRRLGEDTEALIAPWRAAIAAVNPPGRLVYYPGSPEIARQLMRRGDKLNLNELHPEDHDRVVENYGRDKRVVITRLDAGIAIKAQLPPPERRGLALIDPPYEAADEIERSVRALAQGYQRFATGIFCLWYPVTGDGLDLRLGNAVRALSLPATLQVELLVRTPVYNGGLAGSGLIIINPPWRLVEELSVLLPVLQQVLAQSEEVQNPVQWLIQQEQERPGGQKRSLV
jgi:23S rRNA (adenine2030-N6)-methyltransferase